ncbi:TPA: ribosome maturation factor RimP [bacterium]|nr:ribosome maturation factor RimP [bacterium]
MDIANKVKTLIMQVLEEEKVNLFELVYEKEGNENYLRIFIERDDLTMDLDTCVSVSEKVSMLLDEADIIKDDYFLEVASPGVERPLKKEEYSKAINKYILIETSEEVEGYQELTGYLTEVSDNSLKIEINLKGRLKVIEVPFDKIKLTRLSFKY